MTRPKISAAKARSTHRGHAPHLACGCTIAGELSGGCLVNLSRTILENSRAIIYVKDLDGRYLFINHRFEEVLGITAAELVGRTDYHVHPPHIAEPLRANDARVIASGKPEEIEETIIAKGTNEPRHYMSVKEPLFDERGRPFALCGISTDITELRRAEADLRLEKLRYRSLVEATAAIVWGTHGVEDASWPQANWIDFTGMSPEQLLDWNWLEAIHPDDRAHTKTAWIRAEESKTPYRVEHRVRRRDGVYRDMTAWAVPILEPDGDIRAWFGVHIDVTEQRSTQAALRESRERLAAALEASGTGIYLWDFKTDEMEWDDRLRDMVGAPPEYQPTGRNILALLHPDDRPLMLHALEEARAGRTNPPAEYRVVRLDGSIRWLRVQGRVFLDEDGQASHSIGGCVDVTDLKLAEERIAYRANHDALTGMPNRALLLATLESRIAMGRSFAFLLLDLDRFKEINDTFGHDHGDAVLRELRPRLAAAVPGAGLIARLGGDEFGIVIDGAESEKGEAAARAIVADLARPIHAGGRALEVGASIGIAFFPEQGRDVTSLMRMADVAMYAAKRSRSGWAIYQPEQSGGRARGLMMIGELRRAIETDQLRLHYQPKVDLHAMVDVGVEALVR